MSIIDSFREAFGKVTAQSPFPFGTGYMRDPADPNDKILSDMAGLSNAIPSDISVDADVVVKNQGGTSSCVGQAVAQGIRLSFIAHGRKAPDLSAMFVYHAARRDLSAGVSDTGTYIRTAMKMVMKLGIPEESYWPFNAKLINQQPAWDAYRYAFQHRGVRGYYRLPITTADIVRKALANRMPVVAGWKVDKSFMNRQGPEVVGAITKDYVGGHAMVIVGYNSDNTFTLLNSWGRTWRNNGRQRVTEDFITKCHDAWCVDVE